MWRLLSEDYISPKYRRGLSVNPKDTQNFNYEVDRYLELKKLYKLCKWEEYKEQIVNSKTNETLLDLACSKQRFFDVARFYQVEYEKRRKEEIMNEERELDQDEEFAVKMCQSNKVKIEESLEDQELRKQATQIQKEALELMMSRNIKYWDSWKVLTIQSLANLCEMKLHRIARLWAMEAKTEDEMIDVMNYMIFGLMKFRNK